MSAPVPYVPPDYVPPEKAEGSPYGGRERRSRDPVNQLGRSLNRLCLEATDRFEIVAHLEALGFNSPNALARLGVENHFDLAADLYTRTPKAFAWRPPRPARELDVAGPLAMALAFAVTFALGAFATVAVLAPALWVLVWSQASAALLARAEAELEPAVRREILALLLQVGLAGLGAVWIVTPYGLDAAASALLWYGVAGLLWAERRRLAVALPLVAGAGLALGEAWGGLPVPATTPTLAATAALCGPLLLRDVRGALAWELRRPWRLAFPVLYGAGQALVVVGLLRHGPEEANVVPGAVLLAAILLAAPGLLLELKARLVRRLWTCRRVGAFVAAVRRLVLLYAGVYLAPVALALALGALRGPQPWFFHWHAFALFGLCLALAVAWLTLGEARVPGLLFPLAGAAALAGAVLAALAGLALAQLLLLLLRAARFERYALHLL